MPPDADTTQSLDQLELEPAATPVDAASAAPDADPQASPPPAPPAAFDFWGALAEHRVNRPEGVSEKEFLASILTEYQQAQLAARQNQHFAQQYQQLQPKLDKFQQWEQEQARQAQQSREQPQKHPLGRPEVDDTAFELLEKGVIVQDPQTGRYVVHQNLRGQVSPTIAEQLNQYSGWLRKTNRSIADDPEKTLWPAFEKKAEELATRKAEEIYRRMQVEDYEKRNWNLLWQPNGQGGWAPTQEQTWLRGEVQRLQQRGMSPEHALSEATERLHQHLQHQQAFRQPPAAPAAPPAADPGKQNFAELVRKRASHSPNGSGKAPPSGRPDLNETLNEIFGGRN